MKNFFFVINYYFSLICIYKFSIYVEVKFFYKAIIKILFQLFPSEKSLIIIAFENNTVYA